MAKFQKVSNMEPMPELARQFYNDSAYQYLKKVIGREGFKRCYPIRGIWNKRKKKFEIFDGIHRLKIAQDLEIKEIPFEEERILDREQCIAEGIKANKTHATYNPIDLANHLKSLGEVLRKGNSSRRGRPEKIALAQLSLVTGMDENLIFHYVNLLRLPESVQKLIGQGKLETSKGTAVLALIGTPHEDQIPELAQQTVSKGWTRDKLTGIVQAIKKGGHYEDAKLCDLCGEKYPSDLSIRFNACPECGRKREELKKFFSKDKNESMRKFLKLKDLAKKTYPNLGVYPEWLQKPLEQFYYEWQGKKLEMN